MEALESATLREEERRALEAAVGLLEEELGDELLAVWLYGSRARGEVVPPDSDVDVLAITRERVARRDLHERVFRAIEEAGGDPLDFSLRLLDRAWVAEKRRIESFFMQDVDRDKIVVAGPKGGEIPGLEPFQGYASSPTGLAGMSPRSSQQLEKAFDRIRLAERLLAEGEDASSIASLAYYAMLYAAGAALSEENRQAKTHTGTWNMFREAFARTGRFDLDLANLGERYQGLREDADYGAITPSDEATREVVGDARRFVDEVSRMLGVEPY